MPARLRYAVLGLLVLTGLSGVLAGARVGPATGDAAATTLPPLPRNWPSTLQLGMADAPGGAASMLATAPFGFRYQYLAGGVNTGSGWANWNSNGQFVTYYVQESAARGITPVFSYYMIYQSAPGNSQGESAGIATNLGNTSTMTAYWNDLKLFFQRAGANPSQTVVLHVEPDMWGFAQQRSTGDDARTVPARVGSTGIAELQGLPDTIAGLAQGIVRLRDTYAPNVLLGYHLSVWGTGVDIGLTKPGDATVDALAARAAAFYSSLGASFDVAFAEFSDRDAGFKQAIYGDGGASWWGPADFARNVRFLGRFSTLTQKRIVMWQIPYGNTKMRAMNNTWNHYQDNRVEWLLDDPTRNNLGQYVQAGVIAFLFGRGADGATCACDGNGDGVTNPPAINGNTVLSLNADDDGGFFRLKASDYYNTGAMALPGGATPAPAPTQTATPTATASPTPSPTPSPTATPSPTVANPASVKWTASASVRSSQVKRGVAQRVTVNVRASATTNALVDVEIFDGAGRRVHQYYVRNVSFTGGVAKQFATAWTPPTNAPLGTYTVKIGVFTNDWSRNVYWNNSAVTFRVVR